MLRIPTEKPRRMGPGIIVKTCTPGGKRHRLEPAPGPPRSPRRREGPGNGEFSVALPRAPADTQPRARPADNVRMSDPRLGALPGPLAVAIAAAAGIAAAPRLDALGVAAGPRWLIAAAVVVAWRLAARRRGALLLAAGFALGA